MYDTQTIIYVMYDFRITQLPKSQYAFSFCLLKKFHLLKLSLLQLNISYLKLLNVHE
jgi:hypothetical protein